MKSITATRSNLTIDARELRNKRKAAIAYAKAAVNGLNDGRTCGDSLLALRAIAVAFGRIEKIAANVGITRNSLFRSLSPIGNPRITAIQEVLKPLGLRLSVVEKKHSKKKPTKPKVTRKAA